MRLWTVHPRYLDSVGLLSLWREALLARKVLLNRTTGYRHHPQLRRFRDQRNPVACINSYLAFVHTEAVRRGYRSLDEIAEAHRHAEAGHKKGHVVILLEQTSR